MFKLMDGKIFTIFSQIFCLFGTMITIIRNQAPLGCWAWEFIGTNSKWGVPSFIYYSVFMYVLWHYIIYSNALANITGRLIE